MEKSVKLVDSAFYALQLPRFSGGACGGNFSSAKPAVGVGDALVLKRNEEDSVSGNNAEAVKRYNMRWHNILMKGKI